MGTHFSQQNTEQDNNNGTQIAPIALLREEVSEGSDDYLSDVEDPFDSEQAESSQQITNRNDDDQAALFEWNEEDAEETWDLHPRFLRNPPRVVRTRALQCNVQLQKETLRLIPHKRGDKTVYQLQFNFDAVQKCKIGLFFVGKELRDKENKLIGYESIVDENKQTALFFEAGFKQSYIQPLDKAFDPSLYNEEDLIFDPDRQTLTYPVIIVLDTLSESKKQVTSQTTFATFLKCSDDSLAIKEIKVKIEFGGNTYVVHDIFGLQRRGEAEKECVICMTESRDTIVLPCRHMCLCRGCADLLRYQSTKCPICRSPFVSLLNVKVAKEKAAKKASIVDVVESGEEEGSLKRVRKPKRKKKCTVKKEVEVEDAERDPETFQLESPELDNHSNHPITV